MDDRLKLANKNIEKLISSYISLKAKTERVYCPYDGCIYEQGDDYSCSTCKADYWNKEAEKMVKNYTVK